MISRQWTNWDARRDEQGFTGLSPTAVVCLGLIVWFSYFSVTTFRERLVVWKHVEAGDRALTRGKRNVALREFRAALKEMPNSLVVQERLELLDPAAAAARFRGEGVRERRTFVLQVMDRIVSMIFWLR